MRGRPPYRIKTNAKHFEAALCVGWRGCACAFGHGMPCPYCRKNRRPEASGTKSKGKRTTPKLPRFRNISHVATCGTGVVFMTAWPAGPVLLNYKFRMSASDRRA